MSKARFKAVRDVTPSRDIEMKLPVWKPPSTRDTPPLRGVGRFLPAGYQARTLDDLRNSCGQYVEAAINEAEAAAVNIWTMKEAASLDLGIPAEVICAALCRCRSSARNEDGYPSISGRPEVGTLDDLSPGSSAEAKRIYADVYAMWKAAGCPHLASAVQNVRQTINFIFRREDELNREDGA